MAVNYVPAHSGNPGDVDSEQRNPLLMVIKGDDGSEWIYLKGVASLAVKEAVVYDEAGVTARTGANSVGPVAVAHDVAVPDANTEYGWFCIKSPLAGLPGLAGAAVADNKALYLHATAGTFDDAATTGDFVIGAYSRSAPTGAGALLLHIDHPMVTDVLG